MKVKHMLDIYDHGNTKTARNVLTILAHCTGLMLVPHVAILYSYPVE